MDTNSRGRWRFHRVSVLVVLLSVLHTAVAVLGPSSPAPPYPDEGVNCTGIVQNVEYLPEQHDISVDPILCLEGKGFCKDSTGGNLTYAVGRSIDSHMVQVRRDSQQRQCLYLVSLTVVTTQSICVTLEARRENHTANDTLNVCITFNYPPSLTLPLSVLEWNVAAMAPSQSVPIEVNDVNATGIRQVSIAEVQPQQYYNLFSIQNSSIPVLTVLRPEVNQQLVVVIEVNLTDAGFPPLSARQTYNVTFYNDTLTCPTLDEVSINIGEPGPFQVDLAPCVSSLGFDVTYRVNDSASGELGVTLRNSTLLLKPPQPSTLPRFYDVIVEASTRSRAEQTLQLPVQIGLPPVPRVGTYFLEVGEGAAVGEVTTEYIVQCAFCEHAEVEVVSLDGSSPPVNVSISMRTPANLTVQSSTLPGVTWQGNATLFNMSGYITVASPLESSGYVYSLAVVLKNDFGETKRNLTVRMVDDLSPPVFSASSYNQTVAEDARAGTLLLTLTVADPNLRGSLLLNLTDLERPVSALPIALSNTTVIVSGKLNATARHVYRLRVTAQDSQVPSSLAFADVTVTVQDVNEPPTCNVTRVTSLVDVSASPGTLIASLNCRDFDLEPQNRNLSYEFLPGTPSVISDHLDIRLGNIRVLKPLMTALPFWPKANGTNPTFRLEVKDGGVPPGRLEVDVFLNLTDSTPPSCEDPVTVNVTDISLEQSNCTPPLQSCFHPSGAPINYSIVTAPNSSLALQNQPAPNGSYVVCFTPPVVPGTYQLAMGATAYVVRTSFQLTLNVLDTNQAPRFVGPRHQTVTVSERSPLTQILVLSAQDPDLGHFANLTFSASAVNGTGGPEIEFLPSGVFRVARRLNASVTSDYNYSVTVTDEGGLNDTIDVSIHVEDADDIPVCSVPFQIRVNVTQSQGVIGQIQCFDYDVNPAFRNIFYHVDDGGRGLVTTLRSGSLVLQTALPTDTDQLRLTVSADNGNQSSAWSANVTLLINRDFPPECEASSLTSDFSEKEVLCSSATLTCNNTVSTPLTFALGSGNLTSALEVRPVTSTNQQLTLRLCVTRAGSNVSSYYTNVIVGNGLGNTTVTLYANINDVNDPPYFLKPRYEVVVPDDSAVGKTLAFVLVKTEGFGVVDIPSNVYAYDPDANQAFKIRSITADGVATLKDDPSVTVNVNLPIAFMGRIFKVTGRLNNSLDYRFTVWAIDGGNLNDSTQLVFNVSDVNQPPSCQVTATTFTLSLADDPGQVSGLPRMSCTDQDYLPENRHVTFSVIGDGAPYFDVSQTGDISLIAKLPRDRESLNLTLRGSDGGTPSLSDIVAIQVQILRNVSAECKPAFRYPPIWVIGSCMQVLPHCTDPSLPPTQPPSLTFTYQGNFSQGFNISQYSNGTAELCYKLTTNGTFSVLMTVDNGLEPVTVPLEVEVEYLRSTPQFSQSPYVITLPENAVVGRDVIIVSASTQGNFSGDITYAVTGGSPQTAPSAFRLDASTGEITVIASLRPFVGQKVTLTVQATDSYSLLKSYVDVEITVTDVNDPPECVALATGQLTVASPVDTSAVLINCTDPDLSPLLRTLSFTLTALSENATNFFAVSAKRSDPSQAEVTVKAALPLRQQHQLAVHVNDGNNTVSFNVTVNVTLEPPPPELQVTSANSSSIGVSWSFQRTEYRDLVLSYTLQYSKGQAGERPSVVTLSSSDTSALLSDLDPSSRYLLTLITGLRQGKSLTSDIAASTLEVPVLTDMLVGFRVVNAQWNSSLSDLSSPASRSLALALTEGLQSFFVNNGVRGVHSIRILGFRSGSILVDGVVSVNQTGNISLAAQRFTQASALANYTITQPFVSLGNTSLTIDSLVTSGQALEGQEADVTCTARAVSAAGERPSFRWTLGGAPIEATSQANARVRTRVTQVPGDLYGFQGVLTFSPVRPLDKGTVVCIVTLNRRHSANKSLDFDVIRLPKVTLQPTDPILRVQQPFNLTCHVTGPLSVDVNVTWYKNSLLYQSQGNAVSSRQFTLTVPTAENATYGCQATNIAGMSEMVTSTVVLITQTAVSECPADGEWPSTPTGLTATLDCGPGLSGTMTRRCEQGTWDLVNRTLCRRNTLVEIADKVRLVRDGVKVNTTELLVTELATLTSAGQLGAGDLNLSIAVLEDVEAVNANSRQPVPENEIQNFVAAADNILTQNADEWGFVQKSDRSRPGALIKTVETMGRLASQNQNYTTSVFGSMAIVLEVGRSRAKDIYFPNPQDVGIYPQWVMGEGNQALLRSDAFQNMLSDAGSSEVAYSGVYYRNLSHIVDLNQYSDNTTNGTGEIVNSRILSFSVDNLTHLEPPLQLIFKHIRTNASNPTCNFLNLADLTNMYWSTEGCRVNSTNATHTVCLCDHLTNFAILMSPSYASETDSRILSIISLVGCSISIFCLLVTIIVNVVLWRYVKSDRSVILMMLCVALLLCYVIFLAGVTQTTYKAVCTTVAALLHYFYLVAFCLMLAEGVEVLISVVYVFATRSRLWWLSLLAWGCPAVIVGVSLGVTRLEGYGGTQFCWLSLESNLIWAFVGPALAVILTNFIVVIIVLKTMMKTTAMLTKSVREKSRAAVKAICVLMPVMGLTWVFGVFSVNRDLVVFQYLFTIFNSLQGLLIFIFHCCLSRQIQDGMKSRKRRYRSRTPNLDTKSTTQGHTTSHKSTVDSDRNNDLDRKVSSPFLEADRQVQEMVDKLSKVDSNNLQDFLAADKALNKNNIPPSDPQPRHRTPLATNIYNPPDPSPSPLHPRGRGTVDLLNDLGEREGVPASPEAVRLEFDPSPGPTVEEEINAAVFEQQQRWDERQQPQKSKVKMSWGRKSGKSQKKSAPEPPETGSRKEKNKASPRKSWRSRKTSDSGNAGLSPRASQYAVPQDDFERKMRERQDRVNRIYGVDDLLWDERKNKRLPRISVGYDVAERSTPDLSKQRAESPDRWHKVKESFLKKRPTTRPQSPPPGPPQSARTNPPSGRTAPQSARSPRLVQSQDDVSRFGLHQPFGGIRIVARAAPWDRPPTLQDRPPTWQEPSADYW